MRYYFFSFDADTFPVAYKLQQQGESVTVCQIENGKVLGTDSWITEDEEPEKKKRRMSLYDGMLDKLSLTETYKRLQGESREDTFVIVGHNALCSISEKVLGMGFTGLLPTQEDFDREKKRQKSKEFVKKNYPDLTVAETKQIKGVDNVIKFINDSNDLWVVKSDGNFGETIVPDTNDLEMGKMQIESELNLRRSEYEKGSLVLEKKIPDAIEFSPQMVFWNGEPVYSIVELETRMFGAADIGPQTGGNQNVVFQTELDCPLNKKAFPEAMMKIAKEHKGMFIADAGILAHGKTLYFTEFCGNRHGWGGIFSELSASMNDHKEIANYYESLVAGEPPYNYIFGSSVAVYNLASDSKFAGLGKDGVPINMKSSTEKDSFLMQCKKTDKQIVSVGYRGFDDGSLGYITGRGDMLETAVSTVYESLKGISLKGLYYRSREDLMSTDYVSSIPNRLKYLESEHLI